MTGQRTRFSVRRGHVALPTTPAPKALGMPLATRSAEDTVDRREARRYRVILNTVGTGPLVLMCRYFGRQHSAATNSTKASAAQGLQRCPGDSPKGRRNMRHQSISALLMAGLAVLAVVTAFPADARTGYDETHGTPTCRTNISGSINAVPGLVAPRTGGIEIPWQTGGRRTYGGRR